MTTRNEQVPGWSKPKLTSSDLLAWATSITAATSKEDAPSNPTSEPKVYQKLDPKWLDIILGKEDSVQMRELMTTITDPGICLKDKITSFDHFELLIENLDNANDLRNLGLWPKLVGQLFESVPVLRYYAVWCIGTCVQNNFKAQDDFAACEVEVDSSDSNTSGNDDTTTSNDKKKRSGVERVLEIIGDDTEDIRVRAKAFYCISGFIKQNPKGLEKFEQLGGYTVLWTILKTQSTKRVLLDESEDQGEFSDDPANIRLLQKKTIFLLRALLEGEGDVVGQKVLDTFVKDGVVDSVVALLDQVMSEGDENVDADFVEKALEFLLAVAKQSAKLFTEEQKAKMCGAEGLLKRIGTMAEKDERVEKELVMALEQKLKV